MIFALVIAVVLGQATLAPVKIGLFTRIIALLHCAPGRILGCNRTAVVFDTNILKIGADAARAGKRPPASGHLPARAASAPIHDLARQLLATLCLQVSSLRRLYSLSFAGMKIYV